jgi:hypothetical protein
VRDPSEYHIRPVGAGPICSEVCLQLAASSPNLFIQELFDEFNQGWTRRPIETAGDRRGPCFSDRAIEGKEAMSRLVFNRSRIFRAPTATSA